MEIKHHVHEAATSVKQVEMWTTTYGKHDIIVTEDEHSGVEVSIASTGDGLMLGIVRFRPKSVSAIDDFVPLAMPLFAAVADMLRELGKSDLRSELERKLDDMTRGLIAR